MEKEAKTIGSSQNGLTDKGNNDTLKSSSKRDVWVPGEGLFSLYPNTKISKVVVFAGKNSKHPVRISEHLTDKYGGDVSEWTHVRGEAFIDYRGKKRRAEIHWFENPKVGRIESKVKRWFE